MGTVESRVAVRYSANPIGARDFGPVLRIRDVGVLVAHQGLVEDEEDDPNSERRCRGRRSGVEALDETAWWPAMYC